MGKTGYLILLLLYKSGLRKKLLNLLNLTFKVIIKLPHILCQTKSYFLWLKKLNVHMRYHSMLIVTREIKVVKKTPTPITLRKTSHQKKTPMLIIPCKASRQEKTPTLITLRKANRQKKTSMLITPRKASRQKKTPMPIIPCKAKQQKTITHKKKLP